MLMLNQWALAGDWTIERGESVLNEAGMDASRSASTREMSIS